VGFSGCKIRLGRLSYKNTLPLFHRVSLPFVELKEGTPFELSRMLDAGLIEGGILSSLYYLQNSSKFVLVPDISISSFGKVGSVLLFSRKPLREIREITPSSESLTSNFITYALFRKFLGQKVSFVPEGGEALLVIGDRALNFPAERDFPYRYDIGELWFKETGLPAVFALFIVPRTWAVENPEKFAKLSLELINSRETFFRELNNLNLSEDLKRYLLNLDYRFREEHLKSLELLQKLLREYYLKGF